ncbi:MAG: amidase [Burkholderiales bacterium]|nr:amidase [Burkholderiales bacterium]
MTSADLCLRDATELAHLVRTRAVSCTELLDAHLARIERINPALNAVVSLAPEHARARARQVDQALARGAPADPLAGLPTAVKDLVPTAGLRTTFGSLVYRDHVPAEDALIVERLKAAGAVIVGKTNTPEFGAGAQTFNAIFGATRNPYDPTKTCGGSSGGAAVAVACGMVPFADGSDLAASLRNPASFCNVVGFRPSVGRIPDWPVPNAWATLSVLGPIARTAADCALALTALAGPDPRSPVAIAEPGTMFGRPLERDFRGVRVAWSRDLGGLPVDPRVTRALESQRGTLAALGCVLEDAAPDFSGATEAFRALRAHEFASRYAPLLERHRDRLKATVVWNIEAGLRLTAGEIARAESARTEIFHRARRFFERHAFLACPTVQVPPFPLEVEYPTEIDGVRLASYFEWLASCYRITLIGHPAISVPCGFTDDGLPVGLQIVGRFGDDFGVLQMAHSFEQATGVGKRRPPVD